MTERKDIEPCKYHDGVFLVDEKELENYRKFANALVSMMEAVQESKIESTTYQVIDYNLVGEDNTEDNRVFNHDTAMQFTDYSAALEYSKKAQERGYVGASLVVGQLY